MHVTAQTKMKLTPALSPDKPSAETMRSQEPQRWLLFRHTWLKSAARFWKVVQHSLFNFHKHQLHTSTATAPTWKRCLKIGSIMLKHREHQRCLGVPLSSMRSIPVRRLREFQGCDVMGQCRTKSNHDKLCISKYIYIYIWVRIPDSWPPPQPPHSIVPPQYLFPDTSTLKCIGLRLKGTSFNACHRFRNGKLH